MARIKKKTIEELRTPTAARVLLWDIETAPIKAHVWKAWEANFLWKVTDWYLLSIAWKWLGDDEVQVCGLDDFVGYKDNPEDDYSLAYLAWELFNEADIVVAHNGRSFDTKKAKARMIIHGFEPTSPFLEVDTLRIAKEHFAFTKQSLGDVCEDLGIGEKLATGGAGLWRAIVENQDPEAWAKMKLYNKHDVELLEELYLRLRPWSKTHPNMLAWEDRKEGCPKCGDTKALQEVRGYRPTVSGLTFKIEYKCHACTGFYRGRENISSVVDAVNGWGEIWNWERFA